MATVSHELKPGGAYFAAANIPEFAIVLGTNFPVPSLKFDAANDEAAYWDRKAFSYATGGALAIEWYADTASTGDVVWEVAVACITPDTDTQDIETKAYATSQKVTDSHLGTTGQRLHTCSITIANLDSMASGDRVFLRVRRLGSTDAADTMAGDAHLLNAMFTYSDT